MRYVILDHENGVFLGTHKSKIMGPTPIPLWSSMNMFGLTKAYSFNTRLEAAAYIEAYLREHNDIFVGSVDSESTYVDIVDLIKSGYSIFTEDMMDALPMMSEKIH